MEIEKDWEKEEAKRVDEPEFVDDEEAFSEFSDELGVEGNIDGVNPSLDSVHRDIEDSYIEFSGELGPGQAFSSGMAPRVGQWADKERIPAADAGNERDKGGNRTTAWIAIVLAIGSLLFWPAVLGPAAVVMGAVAYASGNKSVGIWSVALGLLSVIAYFVLLPRLY